MQAIRALYLSGRSFSARYHFFQLLEAKKGEMFRRLFDDGW